MKALDFSIGWIKNMRRLRVFFLRTCHVLSKSSSKLSCSYTKWVYSYIKLALAKTRVLIKKIFLRGYHSIYRFTIPSNKVYNSKIGIHELSSFEWYITWHIRNFTKNFEYCNIYMYINKLGFGMHQQRSHQYVYYQATTTSE